MDSNTQKSKISTAIIWLYELFDCLEHLCAAFNVTIIIIGQNCESLSKMDSLQEKILWVDQTRAVYM
jgi:hypothetical protein